MNARFSTYVLTDTNFEEIDIGIASIRLSDTTITGCKVKEINAHNSHAFYLEDVETPI